MTKGRILVVEDDVAILEALREKLRREDFEVLVARDGEEARDRLSDLRPDLVILDIMLPRLDGLSVLRWLRKFDRELPVLIISARGREDEKVEGLKAGADDYLAKPFGLKELMARVESLLRRTRGPEGPVEFGDIRVDFHARKVLRRGKEVHLSKKELEILLHLARHRGRVIPRQEILESVWGYFAESADRAVDFHILNLRKKLEADPGRPRHLVTQHGLGYQFLP